MASLPFKGEYAKSGRAGCKLCKTPIEKGTLRLAVMVQSRFHDGKDAHWFHSKCFFQKQRPPSVGDIEDYETLRYEDQKMIKEQIAANAGGAAAGPTSSGKGKKGKSGSTAASETFSVGYAKSARSGCAACEEFIPKGKVRISQKDFTSERAILYSNGAGMDRWHHVDCFVKIREEISFYGDATILAGFKDLDREDQAELKKKLPAISQSKRKLDQTEDRNGAAAAGPAKKIKTDVKSESLEDKKLGEQSKLIYANRDAIESGLKKGEILQVLKSNKQTVPEDGLKPLLDLAADIMTFGAMKKCLDCGDGQFIYKSGVGYQCTGYINEFTKCSFVQDGDVPRTSFRVPNDLREHPFFTGRVFKMRKRIIPKHVAPIKGLTMGSSVKGGPKLNKNPLSGFKFMICGCDKKKRQQLEDKIKTFGGELTSKCSAKVAAVVTTEDVYKTKPKEITAAQKCNVAVVSVDFVVNLTELNYKLVDEMKKYLLSDWTVDLNDSLKNLNPEFEKPKGAAAAAAARRNEFERKEESVKKLKLKDGSVIDPESGLDDGPYHVFKEGKLVYNCVLNYTSVEDGSNSFYKMQIIESDGAPKSYHVFRAWGRIGTTIGGNMCQEQASKQDAIDLFCEKFEEKTANTWGRKFVKRPGKYTSLELDYSQKERDIKLVPSASESQLPLAVQSLISLIFDVGIMKQTMMEFELDTEKMPLGKISREQILKAYSVLSDSFAVKIEENDERKLKRMVLDISNRFYTLIPHSFGTAMPPLLDNPEILKNKLEMLDNLLEIEIAYELLVKGEDGSGSASIDSHYKTLNAAIDQVEAHSEEYKIIQKYLSNTHAETHSSYSLEIEEVFKVNRKGENKRYRPFKEMHNRRLLWHGSRITNFAGILSQGLRIAPPEAPVTGYMFGKGIYFADMVSKSANYCNTSRNSTTGILLLCEVALGDMHELKQAKDTITKPPKDKHSVKGLGETEPDPSDTHTLPDGVMVPYGKPVKSKIKNTALLYNEYIVYDISQVNIKYLLRVNFNYGGRRK